MSRRYIDANALMAKIDGIIEYIETEIEQAKQHPEKYARTYILSAVSQLLGIAHAQQEILEAPSAQPEIVRCKHCKHWKQQTNYAGAPLSFGFCESDDMWRSLYGETYEVSHIDTDDDFYCGYAERKTDG